MTDAITIQNPRNRGGSTGHVLAKRSVTFTEIRMTGIDSPYEEPEHPNLRVDTTGRAVEQVVQEIYAHLQAIKFIADDSQDGF